MCAVSHCAADNASSRALGAKGHFPCFVVQRYNPREPVFAGRCRHICGFEYSLKSRGQAVSDLADWRIQCPN
jgi:hypothetical protein